MLAAIVLPMVMDQEPKPQAEQEIQIRIPAQDAGSFTSRILPVKPGAVPTPLPPAAALPETRTEEPKKQVVPPEPPAARADAKGESRNEPQAAEKSAPPRPAEAKAAARLAAEPKAKPAPAPQAADQWVVQLGAFRDPANVRNLTAKLKQLGYDSYTETLPAAADGGARTRVRAGPFAGKAAAEAARERINKRLGMDGSVAQK
ncbi:MAG TPA: SPOR domain-containing protein [Candidatus Desulfobacillus sp.]|nr:SPOR domain-containing protein [Candidatus Desulfobacillus sp.]